MHSSMELVWLASKDIPYHKKFAKWIFGIFGKQERHFLLTLLDVVFNSKQLEKTDIVLNIYIFQIGLQLASQAI